MKNESAILARRYAQAYVNMFGTNLTRDIVQRLPIVSDILERHRSLLVFAGLHATQERSKKHIIDLFIMAGFDASLYASLIDLVASHHRLSLIPFILRNIYKRYLETHGIMHFTLESALPLHDNERDAFIAFLRKKTDKEIQYTLVINPALIAGIKMYSDTLGFEYSVQQRLFELASMQSPTT